MRNIIFFVAIVLALATAAIIPIKKNLARTVAPETVALEVEFLGTCQYFTDRVLPTVSVSNYQADGCLPISTTSPFEDVNDLNVHWFCTRVDEHRSVVHFVEVYAGLTDTPSAEVTPFVISFAPGSPFRVLTPKVSINRRPNCEVGSNYCNNQYGVVLGCQPNRIDVRRGWVLNKDRVYLTVGPQVVYECQNAVPSCCAYVSPTLLTTGICPHRGNEGLFSLPEEHHEEHHEEEHHEEENRPEEHRPEHNNNHYENNNEQNRPEEHHEEDRPEQHRPEHNNNHYVNNNNEEDREDDRHDGDRNDGDRNDGDRNDEDRHDEDREDDRHDGDRHDGDRDEDRDEDRRPVFDNHHGKHRPGNGKHRPGQH